MEPNRRKANLKFAAAVAALVAAVPLGYFVFLRRPAPPPPVAVVVDAGVPVAQLVADAGLSGERLESLRIAEVDGEVEVRRGKGEFGPAQVGALLRADDAVRTGDGRALLSAGESYEVRVEPGSLVEVEELTERISRFDLGVGMLVARVEGKSGRQLVVTAAGSDASATTSDGTFALSNNGEGTVAVGARSGEVEFQAAGKAVVLRSGQQSISHQGAPSDPEPIPSSLLLKVDWPQEEALNKRRIVVGGKTSPGAVVMLSGRPVRVGRDGRFREKLVLREGRNVVQAEGLDVGGHASSRQAEIHVDTRAPDSDISTRKLWE